MTYLTAVPTRSSRAHCASFYGQDREQATPLAVDGWDGPAHQAVTRLASAGEALCNHRRAPRQLPGIFRRAGLSEDIALDHAHAELADELEIIVGLDAFGAAVHAERFGEG